MGVFKYFIIVIGVAFLAGCSPESYRRSADFQVNQILKDREKETLTYVPEVVTTDSGVSPIPQKQAYSKVPATTMPTGGESPIEPAPEDLPLEPLGPVMIAPENTTGPLGDIFGAAAADRVEDERLVMGPPLPRDLPVRFDLFSSLQYAVQNSRIYQTQMENLYLAALNVTLERHLFEPRFFARQDFEVEGGGQDVDYRSALLATTTLGVRQQLPYGGEVVARTLVNFVDALNGPVSDGESAVVILSGSVPLLRGAGMVNLEPLIASERELVYQVRQFEDFRRSFAVDIASDYFSLLTLQQRVQNQLANYTDLLQLTEQTKAYYKAGRISYLEVQRSLSEQLDSENALLVEQAGYQDAIDRFKLRLGMPIEQDMEIVPIELELRIPEIDKENIILLATKYRLDLQTARDQIEDAQRSVQVAQNGLLPDVNLFGEGQIGNSDDAPFQNLNDRTITYRGGVGIDLPIDRVAERNEYRRSLIQLQRAQRNFDQARDQVLADVASSVRNIRLSELSVQIQAQGIDLAQRRLELSNEKLRQGDVTSRDVVESQDFLLQAQDSYNRAKAALQISLLNFLLRTGTLRVDPEAGSIGHALDRAEVTAGQQMGGTGLQ
jgi:outer membrane protein TolC